MIVERNCLDSAATWSARMAAACWTMLGTAKMAGWNLHRYLADCLDSCRLAGGTPSNLERFLPWSASTADQLRWSAQELDSS